MRIIKQHDERDCGAACFGMIASYYKLYLPISKCRELTKTDKTGTNLYGIVNGAEQIGLEAEALYGTPEELLQEVQTGVISVPLIAHVVNDSLMLHYVVVLEIKNGYVLICDPGDGRKKKLDIESFFSCWSGNIVTFRRTDRFLSGDFTKGQYLKFFALLKGQWKKLMGVLIASLIIAFIGILGAFVFQIVIDDFSVTQGYYEEHVHEHEIEHVHEEGDKIGDTLNTSLEGITAVVSSLAQGNINTLFLALLGLFSLQAILHFLRGILLVRIYQTVDTRLTLQYYNHIVKLPVSSLNVRQTGEYLSRFSDSSAIRQAISGATITLFLDSVLAIVGSVILFLESKRLFMISFGMIVLYVLLVFVFKKPVEKTNREVMEKEARLQSYFKESIDGMETVKATTAEEQVKETTSHLFSQFLKGNIKRSILSISQDTLASTIEIIGTIIILWIGFLMVSQGELTLGTLITFYALLSYFTEPIKNLIELQPTVQTALVAAERLNDILELRAEQTESDFDLWPGESNNNEFPENVECYEASHIDFRYGNHETALNDVSLSFKRGERIAIIGESGSGKTTLVKLFLRFYEPEKGAIKVDNHDVSEYSLNSLRNNIAYVDRNAFFFTDTIRNNLSLGRNPMADAELNDMCEASNLKELIESLPMGYDTLIDENGSNLSGGQRQRLAIARAIAKHPQLLILDEATSNLDTVTENAIHDVIFGLNKNMTCIIIAHRLTTVRSCDKIFVMKRGRIVETGSFETLIEKKGEFFRLWNAM